MFGLLLAVLMSLQQGGVDIPLPVRVPKHRIFRAISPLSKHFGAFRRRAGPSAMSAQRPNTALMTIMAGDVPGILESGDDECILTSISIR